MRKSSLDGEWSCCSWPRLRQLIFLICSSNLLNKHLLLLVMICVIAVPGTREMLEIQRLRGQALALCSSQASRRIVTWTHDLWWIHKHALGAEIRKHLSWEIGPQNARFPWEQSWFTPTAQHWYVPLHPLKVLGWTINDSLIRFYFSHSTRSLTVWLVQRLAFWDKQVWEQGGDETGHCRQKSLCDEEPHGYGSTCLLFPSDGRLEAEADELCGVHCRVWTFTQHMSNGYHWKREDMSFWHGLFLSVEKRLKRGTMTEQVSCGINASLVRMLRASLEKRYRRRMKTATELEGTCKIGGKWWNKMKDNW